MESSIATWITDVLSVSREEFNNLPACPFAKDAWLKKKVMVSEISTNKFAEEIDKFSSAWPDGVEVVVIGSMPDVVSSDDLSVIVEHANTTLSDKGFVALEDHPDNVEQVSGLSLNQGKYALVFLQPKDKLDHARKILQSKGYYKNWDPKYFSEVVF